ncbi:MAG: uroporphyrinogen decarboxylase family protein [Spirochaetota bacterium]
MTSRERIRKAVHHQKPDRVPLDLGSTLVTGIQASSYARLKKALGVKGGSIKVYDPFQMLAEVEEEVKSKLGVDTVGIELPSNIFGYKNENWKPFRLFDGTEVLVSGNFQYDVLPSGDIVQYPGGDRNAPPSGKMPRDGFYFDVMVRQPPIEEEKLDPKQWVEQTYSLYTDEELRFLEEKSKWYFDNTDYSLVGNFWGAGFGDIAIVPGPHIPHPVGIRDPEEWYISSIVRRNYIRDIFYYQFELEMKNLKMYREAVEDRIDVITMSGTDFGSQNGPFISPETYRELYKPLHKSMNEWVHENTAWKTFYHTCGSIARLMDDFYETGMDIINPVQISAAEMDPGYLKEKYGHRFVFWGGGVNSQGSLSFGSPREVKNEVKNNLKIFGESGGYVFNNVHNIQATVPTENLMAMFDAYKEMFEL